MSRVLRNAASGTFGSIGVACAHPRSLVGSRGDGRGPGLSINDTAGSVGPRLNRGASDVHRHP